MSYTTKKDRILNTEFGTFKFYDGSTLEIDLSNGKISLMEKCRKVGITDFKKGTHTKVSCPVNTYASTLYYVLNNEELTERDFLTVCFDLNKNLNNRGK